MPTPHVDPSERPIAGASDAVLLAVAVAAAIPA